MTDGVIFDMDGVMIDSERQSTLGWKLAARDNNIDMPEWLIDSFKGRPAEYSKLLFDDYFKGKADYWQLRQQRIEHVHEIRQREGIPVKKGLFELLNYLRNKNIPCAVATSTQKESAEKTLHKIGAWDYLKAVVYGDEVEKGKPEPDIFCHAAKQIGVEPENCIVIEDSITGIMAGHAAGMYVVHVPDTIIIDDDTRKLTNVICDDLEKVIDVIEVQNC